MGIRKEMWLDYQTDTVSFKILVLHGGKKV